MNEFEWRRQMRELRQPRLPPRDLWAGIEAALDETGHHNGAADARQPPQRRRWLFGVVLAASLVLAAGIGWHVTRTPASPASTTFASNASPWKPSDPRLSGAAIELDAAHMELLLAIQQAPNSPALQRLLGRTEQQQTELRQLANQPG
ncbi:hypothetical protein [Rhodanobacter ginsengiterrae]|uniref:hypothetical protein n=1 Tax=Rhodanobacter ginsengiterrae TaxID=2008451 RepID=UPI003CF08F5B